MITRLTILILFFASASLAQTTMPTSQNVTIDSDHSLARTDLARQADAAIRKGVKFLLAQQNKDGSWSDGENTDPEGGATALAVLALLSCGEPHQSPPLDRAIKFLKRARPENVRHATYSIGLRAAVYASLPEPVRKTELPADLRWLVAHLNKAGGNNRPGMYDYGFIRPLGGDYSNSQYGVLGVWYAAAAGMEVPQAYWKAVEDGWLRGQHEDGGWGYMPERPNSYSSMTAAALATLYITTDYQQHARDAKDISKTPASQAIEKGLKWLGENFAVDRNVGRDDALRGPNRNRDLLDLLGEIGRDEGYQIYYMLFSYERVGEASGLTRFGNHKWFEEGTELLVRTQQDQGCWSGSNGAEIDTCYALLFLSRGRAPVMIQKLTFNNKSNDRPRDMASFVRFMRRATERHVNWQNVTTESTVGDLRESPLVYAASAEAISLTDAEKLSLKAYIDHGGMLVCAQDGDGDAFTKSIVSVAAELYPAYTFRNLPADHPAYTFNFPASAVLEPMLGLSNGVRELIVIYPSGDMSLKWQSGSGIFAPKSTPYATLANLWLYATDRANPRFKGEDTWIDNNPGVKTTRTARVARIRHDGNWDPEPGGWTRLVNIMHNLDQCDLQVEVMPPDIRPGAATRPASQPSMDFSSFPLVHLTDTRSLRLSTPLKAELKRYLDKNGLLLMDAAGGSPEAGGSFDELMRELYPSVIIAPLSLEHPIYHATVYGGQDIERVTYRRSPNQPTVRIPRLRGAMVGNKLVAIESYEDLSGGLVGYPTAGLTGYSPTSAVDLMRNIILWRSSSLR